MTEADAIRLVDQTLDRLQEAHEILGAWYLEAESGTVPGYAADFCERLLDDPAIRAAAIKRIKRRTG